ncbi:hypothetical protein B484DRAFT_439515, partial [Ochromonadaceae sp. CCMP2298]
SCYSDYHRLQHCVNTSTAPTPTAELHILVAEAALETQQYDACSSVTTAFLQSSPQKDQCYCRARLVKALLIDHQARHLNGNEAIKCTRFAVDEVMEALNVCTANAR